MRDALRCEHVDHFVHMARLLGIPVPECTLVRGLKDGEPDDPLYPPRAVAQFERALPDLLVRHAAAIERMARCGIVVRKDDDGTCLWAPHFGPVNWSGIWNPFRALACLSVAVSAGAAEIMRGVNPLARPCAIHWLTLCPDLVEDDACIA